MEFISEQRLNNKIGDQCIYWFNVLSKPVKQLQGYGVQLNITDEGLDYSVNGEVLFNISNTGEVNLVELKNLESLIKDIQFKIKKITTYNETLKLLSSVITTQNDKEIIVPDLDGELVLKDNDNSIINVSNILSNGYKLKIPTLNTDATIAVLTDIPGTGNFVTFDGNETITGLKTFSSSLKLSNGIINTNYSNNLLLPQTSGTLALKANNRYRGWALTTALISAKFPDPLEGDIVSVGDAGYEYKYTSGSWSSSGYPNFNMFPIGIKQKNLATNIKIPDPHDGLDYHMTIRKDSNTKITNADGFEKNGFTLSVPTLTSNKTIATTADIPSSSNFITTDNTSQIATGTKRFQNLNIGDSTYTDAQIGVFDSWGARGFTFPKIYGRLMADTDGVTTNTVQNITSQKTFKSGLIVDSGGTLTIANSLRQMYSATNNSLANLRSHYFPSSDGTLVNENYASTITPKTVGTIGATYGSSLNYARSDHKHIIDTGVVCSLNGTQTLTNKTLNAPTFINMNTYKTAGYGTGDTWIDYKKIYKKVITGTTKSSAGVQAYSVGSTIDTLINAYGCLQESDGTQVLLGYTNISSGAQFGLYTSADRKSINLRVGSSSMFSRPFWITIEYTI